MGQELIHTVFLSNNKLLKIFTRWRQAMKKMIFIVICFLFSFMVFSENIQTDNNSIVITNGYLTGINFVIAHIESETTERIGSRILILPVENKFAFLFWGIADVKKSEEPDEIIERREAAFEQSKLRAASFLLDYFQNNIEQVSVNAPQTNEMSKDETFEAAFIDRFCQGLKENEIYYDYIASNHIPPLIIQKGFESKQYKENGYGKVYTIFAFYPEINEKTREVMKSINIKEMLENYSINIEDRTIEVN